MINLYNQVPSVYVNASRDFQYLSWLFNIVLNSVKHNVDSLYLLPNNNDNPGLTELLALTLGFKVKRNYDQKQLAALTEIIPRVLKYKGTEKAITMAGDALIKASGAAGSFSCKVEDCILEVVLPKDLVDTTLFMDILPYILPAGMSCRIIRKPQSESTLTTEVKYEDRLIAQWHRDVKWDETKQTTAGPANMLSLTELDNTGALISNPDFSNYFNNLSGNTEDHKLNTGLLNNTVIPMLDGGAMTDPKSNKTDNIESLTEEAEEK